MAKRKSIAPRSPRLPDHHGLDQRLEARRQEIFKAAAIIGISEIALREDSAIDGSIPGKVASDLWVALGHARELLDSAAGDLEPAVILRIEEAQS